MGKQIILNAFEMTSAMHNSHGLWKHPESKRQRRYKDLDYWIEMAKLLERGKFDAVFLRMYWECMIHINRAKNRPYVMACKFL